MDLRDIFRSFFGINGRNDDNFWKRDSFFDTNENNDSFDYEMNRNFEDMFRSFGQMFNIFNNFPIFGDKDMIEFIDSNGIEESTNPRNLMLRESENEKKGFDFDYDQTVRQNGLNSLIDNKSDNRLTQKEPQIISKSYFYSSTFNNGKMEEKKITKDGFGNEETSVTQRIGDKSITKVIKKNNNDVIEENEMLSNLTENELNDFMRKWNGQNKMDTNNKSLIPIEDNKPNSRQSSLFDRLFNFFS